jgi:hypothetical protein
MGSQRDQVTEHPTYLEHIRHFFEPVDIAHMRAIASIDLGTYEGVKRGRLKFTSRLRRGRCLQSRSGGGPRTRLRPFGIGWSTSAPWGSLRFRFIPSGPLLRSRYQYDGMPHDLTPRRSTNCAWPSAPYWGAILATLKAISHLPASTGFQSRPTACTTSRVITRGTAFT